MSSPTPVPSNNQPATSGKVRNTLIFGTLGVFAAIIFGLIYLFVLAPTVPGGSLGWFLFSFATGITMIVMPCTLPLAFVIVPLSMGKGIVRGLGMALAFGLGVAVMLSTYGIIAALLGGFALEFLGNDIEPIKNWVYFIAGIFALVFALSEIGLLNVHMPTYSGAAPAFIQKRGELIKAFMLGLFLGNVGVGCPHPATPLILIEIASSGDILYGWLMFLVHAIGRVLPLLLLAFMAILGVNGLNWLMTHKEKIERVTGWGMVFVAGFILTLGLFTHDWWVNSGIHNAFEALTQEAFFNAWFNDALNQNVAHVHGVEDGVGLFGQPLWWGHYFLVLVWLVPIWLHYRKKRKSLLEHPSFTLQRIEKEVDRLEEERSRIEETANIDGLDTTTDLKTMKAQIAELKKQRRAAAERVGYGETGNLRNPVARDYEVKILRMKRNFYLAISVFLALVFIYFLPTNFFLKATNPNFDSHGDHGDHGAHDSMAGIHAMPDGTVMDASGNVLVGAHVMPDGTIMLADGTVAGTNKPQLEGTKYSQDIAGLPVANETETVILEDGDTYDITAYYVQKEIGGRTLRMMGYNGSVPGPFLKAKQGAEVTINFTNQTDIDQTIHSHGLRLDNLSDGVPGVTQYAVPPGGSHTYAITFPDSGVYWYHPHTREDYAQELGLYGNYLVSPTEPYATPANREVPLVIDDILIENDRIAAFYKEFSNFALLGRFGNEYLVNGQKNFTMTAQAGEVIRFQVTNVSNARTYNLSLPGARMKKIAADVGQFEREEFVNDFLISPAERMIVAAYFEKPGTYQLMHTMPSGKVELARILVTGDEASPSFAEEFGTLNTNEAVVDEFASFRSYLSAPPDKRLLLTVQIDGAIDHSAHAHGADGGGHDDHGDGGGHDHGGGGVDHSQHAHSANTGNRLDTIQWEDPMQSDYTNTTDTITWKLVDQDTGRESMDIPVQDWTFKVGDLVKVRLTNDANADHVMQHPIHFHGQQFVVLSENGVPNNNLAWKDTVLVFPGEFVDILVDMNNPGVWMNHCHISEHLHAGMMMNFRVEDENGYATGDEFRATVPPGTGHSMPMSDGDSTSDTMKKPTLSTNANQATRAYSFGDTDVVDPIYGVTTENRYAKAGRKESITLSFTDVQGNPVNLDDSVERAVTVTFVKSDDTVNFVTYPGNTIFPEPEHGGAGHDNSDGHHDDGHDNSDGHHGFRLIETAHAHGEVIEDGHHEGAVGRTYSVPVVFPTQGVYRGYVEFILAGETEPRVAYFDMEVTSSSFSIDDYGWSQTTQWWILFLVSIVLTAPLVWGVRRYINESNK